MENNFFPSLLPSRGAQSGFLKLLDHTIFMVGIIAEELCDELVSWKQQVVTTSIECLFVWVVFATGLRPHSDLVHMTLLGYIQQTINSR